MALFHDCVRSVLENEIDTADIVRDAMFRQPTERNFRDADYPPQISK